MIIEIELKEHASKDEMHGLSDDIGFMIRNNGWVGIIESIIEKM